MNGDATAEFFADGIDVVKLRFVMNSDVERLTFCKRFERGGEREAERGHKQQDGTPQFHLRERGRLLGRVNGEHVDASIGKALGNGFNTDAKRVRFDDATDRRWCIIAACTLTRGKHGAKAREVRSELCEADFDPACGGHVRIKTASGKGCKFANDEIRISSCEFARAPSRTLRC